MPKKKDKNLLTDENKVRVIKIGADAIFEFIYENFVDNLSEFMDVDPTSVTSCFYMDWENKQFICCANLDEYTADGKAKLLAKSIDIEKLIKAIPDTTSTMYASGRYHEYTKEELIALSTSLND